VLSVESLTDSPFEKHFPISHWADLWGFSPKTLREWFSDESGPGILRQEHTGRRQKRDYTSIRVSLTAAARIYAKRTGLKIAGDPEVM
jgi:hypothetical protein